MSDDTPSLLNNVITIDDERIKSHLDRVVRSTVEETLNALLGAEADRLCNAQRYERSAARRDTRAGHYERGLQTKAGEVRLRVPKLRRQTFETAIIERYRRRESSVEEALIEMYLAGVSGAPGRGHHGGFVGQASVTLDGVGPEQEDLWDDRGLAQRFTGCQLSLRPTRIETESAHCGAIAPGLCRTFRREFSRHRSNIGNCGTKR
jgi:hypothetical protein